MGKIKECVMLDNSMFDDGSIECKNFQVADEDNSFVCEWDYIKQNFSETIQRCIIEAINKGQRYITLYDKHMDGSEEFDKEISWD